MKALDKTKCFEYESFR